MSQNQTKICLESIEKRVAEEALAAIIERCMAFVGDMANECLREMEQELDQKIRGLAPNELGSFSFTRLRTRSGEQLEAKFRTKAHVFNETLNLDMSDGFQRFLGILHTSFQDIIGRFEGRLRRGYRDWQSEELERAHGEIMGKFNGELLAMMRSHEEQMERINRSTENSLMRLNEALKREPGCCVVQ
jgi:hypothetical protein